MPLAAFAQEKKVPTKLPHYSSKKKKDTTKVNPYLVDTLLHPIPFSHIYIHDKIDKEMKKADLWDGKEDKLISNPSDTSFTKQLTQSLLKDVAHYKVLIENLPIKGGRDSIEENQEKLRCLTAVWEMLRFLNTGDRQDADYCINLVTNMHGMIVASNENKLLEFARTNANIYTLANSKVLMDNQPEARAFIYTYLGLENPKMMIKKLPEYAKDSFAAVIIAADARLEPEQIFNYASSTNNMIRGAVLRTNDSLVKSIVAIAEKSNAPLKAISFLGDLYHGRNSLSQIDSFTHTRDPYYQNLVRLRMGGDSMAMYSYNRELVYRGLQYVRKINDLHEEHDDVRFASIDSLRAIDLFYLIVNGQDEIYTSSFLGVFKRMVERMNPMPGDKFLDTLKYDHFRTFVRMCAGYNTLPGFLATMGDTQRTVVMEKFINGLQNGGGDELEDAVDVADAVGSIKDSALLVFLEAKIKGAYEQSFKNKSKKGMIIYSLLAQLMEGNKISGLDTGAVVTSGRLHLPAINKVQFKDMANDSGVVYQQVFFFGDDDGEKSYNSFMDGFKNEKVWHVDTNQYWTTIASVTGKKIVVYANRPLLAPNDEEAQNMLSKYLADSGIHPTIMVHRGHSYHLPQTLEKLNKYVKIVVLGSCGGYHNLAKVLDKSPDAHIVSSKQTGSMGINDPILIAINKNLLDGADVNWIAIWDGLTVYFSTRPELKEKFVDYVPPYKNLGALFIKAYRKMQEGK